MKTKTPTLARASMSLALAVLMAGHGSAVLAASAEESETPVAERPAGTTLESVKGNSKPMRIAQARAAKDWARFGDPTGDQIALDGSAIAGAEPWTDLTEVNVVRAPANPKMLRKLTEDYPPGTAGGYYGKDADWQKGEDGLFIIARTAAGIPDDVETDVQLIVTFDGPGAMPHEAGSLLGPYRGAQSFSISGSYPGQDWASGTTSLTEWDGTSPIPFFNGPSRDMGYYDFRRDMIKHIAHVPKGATAATVTLRAAGRDGDVFDEVRLPSGGRFIGLDSAAWGLDLKKGGKSLTCRALATFSAGAEGAEDAAPGSSIIRYTVGWDEDPDISAQLSALGGRVELALTTVGSEDAPEPIDATVTLDASTDAATFSLEVPDGQWLLDATEDVPLRTPGGQEIVDVRPLTGIAGVLTGPGRDGFVAGDPSCGA